MSGLVLCTEVQIEEGTVMKAFSLSASLAVSIAGMVFSGATLAQSTI